MKRAVTPAERRMLNEVYRQVEISVADGNRQKTARSLVRRGYVNNKTTVCEYSKWRTTGGLVMNLTLTQAGEDWLLSN